MIAKSREIKLSQNKPTPMIKYFKLGQSVHQTSSISGATIAPLVGLLISIGSPSQIGLGELFTEESRILPRRGGPSPAQRLAMNVRH